MGKDNAISVDYIVIGAGSAGAVMAARLSEDAECKVLLLEAGPPDHSFWIHLPVGYGKTMWNKKYNWCYQSDPDPNMNNRQIYWPRGKTLGGSSSINGLIYIRGQREDYDQWAAMGNTGWSFEECLPYFTRSECNQRGTSEYHGGDGPLSVSDIETKNKLIDSFIAGAGEIGVPATDDFNGADQEGAGYYQLTTKGGWRCSTAKGYLKPARARRNLNVETNAQATGLIMEGKRAVGVRYRQGGELKSAMAGAEVLLCAGALQSPQLLQLSGIGPADLLQEHEISVVHHLPGVGENLQDHLQIRLIYEASIPTINDQLNSKYGQAKLGLEWLLKRSGPLSVGINQGGCFMRCLPDEAASPDIQFHVAALSADMAGGNVHDFSGCTMSVCQLRPESRGYVRIKTSDPFVPPSIQPNYLDTEHDRRTTLAGVRAARAIAQSESMSPYLKREVKPGPATNDYADLLEFCRNYGETIFHPACTCKMGTEHDPLSVLDERLRVKGIQSLRVIDCSSMPTLVSGNTNAPVIMMAEKAADMVREDAAL